MNLTQFPFATTPTVFEYTLSFKLLHALLQMKSVCGHGSGNKGKLLYE